MIVNHNGCVQAESQRGKGTVFTFYLPALSEEEMSVNTTKGANGKATGGTGRILVMNDDEMIGELTTHMLRHLGYEPLLAVNDVEMLELYQKHLAEGSPVDLSIMDLTIPGGGMGGKEAVDKLLRLNPRARGACRQRLQQ